MLSSLCILAVTTWGNSNYSLKSHVASYLGDRLVAASKLTFYPVKKNVSLGGELVVAFCRFRSSRL